MSLPGECAIHEAISDERFQWPAKQPTSASHTSPQLALRMVSTHSTYYAVAVAVGTHRASIHRAVTQGRHTGQAHREPAART